MSTPRPIVYVKRGCPWCDEAEDYLREHGIAYFGADELDAFLRERNVVR
jgi:glutaredoxin